MSNHESEKILEDKMIKQLVCQGYEKVKIDTEEELVANFREQIYLHNIEELDSERLSDKEFERLMVKISGKGVFQSAKELRQKQDIERDNGKKVYIELFNKKEWCKNIYQVTHQTTVEGKHTNRYDVTLLINGLPLVQIELKKRGLDFIEAFNQIQRYRKHSYHGLYRYIQIFIISNGVDTKYFANGDNELLYSNTFYWTDIDNDRITTIEQFTCFFLDRCQVSKLIARYMVINETEKLLMVMRPYQVYAVETLIDRATNTSNNGYIWHTTGSGKTLTSFKASQILALEQKINQVFFLVDRKDLDKQTLDEFNKFDPGCVDMTNQTEKLVHQFKDSTKPLIVTTIQKMANAVKNPRYYNLIEKYKDLKTIFIIDECHRSQFGDMHKAISNHFTNAQYFGFTGTPRFEINKAQDGRTTADIFGKCLHTYLIKDAIRDENVLGFSVDYISTIQAKDDISEEKVEAIDSEEVLLSDERITIIVNNILEHHKFKTRDGMYNALFATSSIQMLTKYYDRFKKTNHDLKIGAIFTYGTNEESESRDEHSRDTLERIIKDYNKMFKTNYSTNTYDSYFKDIAKRIKNNDLDILLVVDMFLTGFDSKKLNTLYVDKKLKYHSLIQAFSRTNRVEKKTKPFGNIVCFDQTKKEDVDDAVKIFSQTDSTDVVLMRPYDDYLKQFEKCLSDLKNISNTVEDVDRLEKEEDKKTFMLAFRDLSRVLVSLQTFNQFDLDSGNYGIKTQELLNYKSKYLKIVREIDEDKNKVSILSDIDFSLELIQTDKINVSYIINLIRNIDLTNEKQKEKDIEDIEAKLINVTDDELYLKLDLIKRFLKNVIPALHGDDSIDDAYNKHLNKEREIEIEDFAKTNNINLDDIQDIISEYEYSGIFPDEHIYQALSGNFLQKRQIINNLKGFIIKLIKKYL
ncbi:MAG: type I restriction endonuclease subunit R [Bacilli bacterium]